jgi:hypothetical protein
VPFLLFLSGRRNDRLAWVVQSWDKKSKFGTRG